MAIGNSVKPVAIPPVLRYTPLVGREQDGADRSAEPFHFDKPQLSRSRIDALDVVAQILFVNVFRIARLCGLICHYHSHGHLLDFRIGLKPTDFRRTTVWMR